MSGEKKEIFLTAKGLLEIEEELDELKRVKRPEIINAIKEARALGDLSENADYHAAREEQAIIEGRIQELEYMVDHAVIIEEKVGDKVSIGCSVIIKYEGDDDSEEYAIQKIGWKCISSFPIPYITEHILSLSMYLFIPSSLV